METVCYESRNVIKLNLQILKKTNQKARHGDSCSNPSYLGGGDRTMRVGGQIGQKVSKTPPISKILLKK
jgi:hypothetical protein